MRNTAQEMDFHGFRLQPMERMMCLLVSANNDESVFPDPGRFDVSRRPNPHLSFSYGPHVCLGQHIAKLEMRALSEELLPRIGSIELIGEPSLKRGNFVTGVKRLPIRFTRA
jgi:cytochrome P450